MGKCDGAGKLGHRHSLDCGVGLCVPCPLEQPPTQIQHADQQGSTRTCNSNNLRWSLLLFQLCANKALPRTSFFFCFRGCACVGFLCSSGCWCVIFTNDSSLCA